MSDHKMAERTHAQANQNAQEGPVGKSLVAPPLQLLASGEREGESASLGNLAQAAPAGLTGSVGDGGDNNADDVMKIQELLVSQGHGITVDGRIGPSTIGSIRAFQRVTGIGSDGLVSAGGDTWNRLNGAKVNEQDVDLVYGDRVDETFAKKTIRIANEIGVSSSNLMAAMAFESAGTFSPSIPNAAGSGAIGLIQFMPATAIGLGTTTAELAQMTAVEQLDYVRAYFLPWKGRLGTLEDIYMAILWPAAVGKSNDYVLWYSGTIAYRQNAGLDSNGDGAVTKGEAAGKVRARYTEGEGERAVIDMDGNGSGAAAPEAAQPEAPAPTGGQQESENENSGGGSFFDTILDSINAFLGISGSVGRGGDNQPGDVKKVQQLLNDNGANLSVDGLMGPNTIAAISAFQQSRLGFQDGLVEKGGKTWGALTSAQSTPAAISDSVGKGGNNSTEDVKTVQQMLSQKGYSLDVDGIMGPNTIAAIESFQQSNLGFSDGRVDVGGKTWNALTGNGGSAPSTPPVSETPVPEPEAPSSPPVVETPTTDNDNQNESEGPSSARGISISQSVGRGGRNAAADVRKIQQALLDIGLNIGSADGVAGQTTSSSIRQFQIAMGIGNDGRVDPGGATLKKINETPNGAMFKTEDAFFEDPNRPVFRHGNFTNRAKLMIDGGGNTVPKQFWNNQKLLIQNLKIIGDYVGASLNINSGYRSPNYNTGIDGAEASNHMWGMAADLGATGIGVYDLKVAIETLMNQGKITAGGIGYYPNANFVHYDVRGHYAPWTVR